MKKSFIELNGTSIKKNTYKKDDYNGISFLVPDGEIYIDSYFDKYEIDERFRKIILLVEKRPFQTKIAMDYVSEIPFYLFFRRNNDGIIEVRGSIKKFTSGNGVYFNDEFKSINRKSVIVFYRQLEELGLLENYLMAIKEFYGLQVIRNCDINELVGGRK